MKYLNVIKLSTFVLFAILFACDNKQNGIDKTSLVAFRSEIDFDNNGMPKDSLSKYFPESIFTDTVEYYVDKSGRLTNPRFFSKERYIDISEQDISLDELRDTIVVETDSVTDHLLFTSYTLYKMGEPSLSNQYLGKEIYRLTVDRAFDRPFVIRIEKDKDKITAYYKILNRVITYPFLRMLTSDIVFEPPGGFTLEYDKEEHARAKRENDSLALIYNNPNYYNEVDKSISISRACWDSIEAQIDTIGFWKTKPYIGLNHLQIDGSRWILEGHIRVGYQIKRILSPHFEKARYYSHAYDENDYYAKLFRFLVQLVKIDEDLY